MVGKQRKYRWAITTLISYMYTILLISYGANSHRGTNVERICPRPFDGPGGTLLMHFILRTGELILTRTKPLPMELTVVPIFSGWLCTNLDICKDRLDWDCKPYKDAGQCKKYPDNIKYWCEKTCFNCKWCRN